VDSEGEGLPAYSQYNHMTETEDSLGGEPVSKLIAFDAHVAGRPLDPYIMRLHSAGALKERPLGGRGVFPQNDTVATDRMEWNTFY
jgi:hypothetical protein